MTLLLPWLFSVGIAAPPAMLNVHLKGDLDIDVAGDAYQSFGWGIRGGVQLVPRLWFEGGVDLSFMPGGRFRTAIYPSLRVFFTKPDARWGGVSLRLGGGVDLGFPGREPVVVQPVLLPALGLDLRLFDDLKLRIDAGYITHFDDLGGLSGQVGVVFTPRKKAPPVVELPPVPFEESGLVWLGAPTCDWSDPDKAQAFIAESETGSAGSTSVDEASTGDGETGADSAVGEPVGATGDAVAPDAVAQGSLVVVAWPGDEGTLTVTPLDSEESVTAPIQQFAEDGVAVITVPEGRVEVSVVGGGRATVKQTVAVSEGFATWVRFKDPADARVLFSSGSAVISEDQKAVLGVLAANTGRGRWSLFGSYSPEGSVDTNVRLGTARAEAVRDVLVAAGVDPERIQISTREFPNPDEAPEEQRSVELVPLPGDAEESP